MEEVTEEQNKVVRIIYDHFLNQYKGDEKKAVAAVNYISDLVQQEGCKLLHFNEVVFMVTVTGIKMVEFHAMIGKKMSETEKLKTLDTELDKLLEYLKELGVALAFTTIPADKAKIFSKILEEYKFKSKAVTGPDNKKMMAFYIGLENRNGA